MNNSNNNILYFNHKEYPKFLKSQKFSHTKTIMNYNKDGHNKNNDIKQIKFVENIPESPPDKSSINVTTLDWKTKIQSIPHIKDSLEIIDRAMEIQQLLYEFSNELNAYFQFQLLLIILTAFIVIIFNCFYLLAIFGGQVKDSKLTKLESLAFLGYELFVCCSNVIGVVLVSTLLQNSFKQTGRFIHKILIYTTDQRLRERLVQFSMQLKYNKPYFSAFGLFPIDGTLIYSIVGATTTYLVILVQFSDDKPNVYGNITTAACANNEISTT